MPKHTHVHTYSDIHRVLWRDDMSRQCWEGKSRGADLLDVYILHLHLFWRDSKGSQVTVINFYNPRFTTTVASAVISYLLTYTLI